MTDPVAAYLAELEEFYKRLKEIEKGERNGSHPSA